MAKKLLTGFGWYEFEQTIQTNISRDYLDGEASWTQWAALRECLQNAADEADYMAQELGGTMTDYVTIQRRGGGDHSERGFIFIQDRGRGCDFESVLLLGKSGKRGLGYRGEKGEGQLMAFLTMAKLDVFIQMYSKDWLIIPKFAPYNGGTNEVLCLDVYRQTEKTRTAKNRLDCGTVWRIDRTDELDYVVANLGDYFPELARKVSRAERARLDAEENRYYDERRKERKALERRKMAARKRKSTSSSKIVFKPAKGKPSRLYLRGIYVRDLTVTAGMDALFSYNLEDGVAINRDRDMVDAHQFRSQVAYILMESDDVTATMRKHYWAEAGDGSNHPTAIEYLVNMDEVQQFEHADEWRDAFYKVYGQQSCFATNQYATADAASNGWKVVSLNPLSTRFAERVGIRSDRQAAGFGDDDFTVVEPTEREAKMIHLCMRIAEELGIKVGGNGVQVVGKVLGNPKVEGFQSGSTTYILRRMFKRDRRLDVLKVVLHELGHYNTGETDFTRRFTDWFLECWMDALVQNHDVDKVTQLLRELVAC